MHSAPSEKDSVRFMHSTISSCSSTLNILSTLNGPNIIRNEWDPSDFSDVRETYLPFADIKF